MPRLHIFNPSHEMALAADSEAYTPPKRIRQMERELAAVPCLWKEEEDIVISVEALDEKGGYARLDREYIPCPWGWNKALRRRLLHFGVPEHLMPTATELAQWRRFASRKFAANYCHELYLADDWGGGLVANHMTFCHDAHSLVDAVRSIGSPYITKTEYSSSGRGIRVHSSEDAVPLKEGDGGLLIDRFYTKLLDFALEYEVTCERVEFLGVSVFEASEEGKYGFNYVRTQPQLLQMIADSGIDMQLLTRLIDYNTQSLSRHLLGRYLGIVGIDMMAVHEPLTDNQNNPASIINNPASCILHSASIHPCVEMNFRMNMGVAAMKISERNRADVEQEMKRFDRSFRATLDGDRFSLCYQKG